MPPALKITNHVGFSECCVIRLSIDEKQKEKNGRTNCSATEGETCGNGVKVSYKVSSGESLMLDLDKEGPDWIGTVLSP